MPKATSISGHTYLFTGTLTEFTRAEAEALVKDNGGALISGVTSKLNYLVVGADAGSKLDKAKALGTVKIITEKEFLKMVPRGTPSKKNVRKKEAPMTKPISAEKRTKDGSKEGARDEDSRDVVVVGNQTWMAKNLDVYCFRDGTPITVATTPEEFESLGDRGIPASMVYGNKKNYAVYGLLYNWYAVKSECGLAPEGFEVASADDWRVLLSRYRSIEEENAALIVNENGRSQSGFNALRGGASYYGQLDAINITCAFWTRCAWNREQAFYQTFGGSSAGLTDRNTRRFSAGFSVRCIQSSCSKSCE